TARLRRGNRLLVSYTIGALGFVAGIVLSLLFDLPTGAIVVWAMAAVAVIAGFALSEPRVEEQN
ncbi:MAG TPA: metal ABC transporter permease, partial [Woeseiaceae bacterium]